MKQLELLDVGRKAKLSDVVHVIMPFDRRVDGTIRGVWMSFTEYGVFKCFDCKGHCYKSTVYFGESTYVQPDRYAYAVKRAIAVIKSRAAEPRVDKNQRTFW
jgi:hypothetical protein